MHSQHTNTHAQTHTRKCAQNTYTHAHMHTYARSRTHTHIHTYTYTHTYTLTKRSHTNTHTHKWTCINSQMQSHARIHTHKHAYTHKHTYIHTNVHTHTHTHTHTRTHKSARTRKCHKYKRTRAHTHLYRVGQNRMRIILCIIRYGSFQPPLAVSEFCIYVFIRRIYGNIRRISVYTPYSCRIFLGTEGQHHFGVC